MLTPNSDGHTIGAIIIASRCLCIHSAEQFQEGSGAG
jgi:hypothetical protein